MAGKMADFKARLAKLHTKRVSFFYYCYLYLVLICPYLWNDQGLVSCLEVFISNADITETDVLHGRYEMH